MGIILIYNNGTVIWIKNVERFLGLSAVQVYNTSWIAKVYGTKGNV